MVGVAIPPWDGTTKLPPLQRGGGGGLYHSQGHPKGCPTGCLGCIHGTSQGLCWEPLWILRSPPRCIWGFGAHTWGVSMVGFGACILGLTMGVELHSGGLERSIVGSWLYCGSDMGVPGGIPEGLWRHTFEYLWKALGLTPKSAYGGLWGSHFGVFLGHKFWEHL